MNGTRRVAGLAILAGICLMLGSALAVQGQEAGAAAQQPKYTMAEYNSYQAAAAEKNPAQQVRLLDDFTSKYPNSALLIYVYPLYYQDYSQLKDWKNVIGYSDKLVALGDKVGANEKYGALYARAYAYNNMNSNDAGQAKAAHQAALAGLALIPELKKPATIDDAAFEQQKKQAEVYLNGTAAQAAMVQKDYPAAITSYKAVLALSPDEAITSYRLGQAYLALNPPQQLDGFWAIARAVTSKNATAQQSTQIKSYLKKLIVAYQQAGCDSLTDAELAELLQLAGTSAERPASYKLPSSADLAAAQKDMTIASVIADLKAGGDKGKVTWLAACGLEFPGVPGKLIEVTPGTDSVNLKVAFVTSDDEFQAATTPNMDVKVLGQPEAARLDKDGLVHFTGTLTSYDPNPAFMLHWDKAKVNADDIPAEKPTKKPERRRPTTRRPSHH
jgi:hypothetical protein